MAPLWDWNGIEPSFMLLITPVCLMHSGEQLIEQNNIIQTYKPSVLTAWQI